MSTELPPSIDPAAGARWGRSIPAQSPWLHEEVARRMEERLQWMVIQPASWVHWAPLRGGVQAHALLAKRYPKSECFVLEGSAECAQATHKLIAPDWWSPARWAGPRLHFEVPAEPVQMLWANMALHMAPDPMALIARWHQLLAVDGFLMFSCLGPDTLREIRSLYGAMGWAPPAHEFTDMHDWGDMLVASGFAEPVMDMERITLSFTSPQTLLEELRGLGRNLHQARFQGLRGRQWREQLHAQIASRLGGQGEGTRLHLTFEIIYGHAFKPQPRLTIRPESSVSLEEMRQSLRKVKKNASNF
ncbi:MAG: biotin synthase [Burkholderiales bacterium]|nr:biotin synthase [Burkholderiales bacterium]